MNKMVRFLALVLVLALLLVPMSASARYSHVNTIGAGLSISGGVAYCEADLSTSNAYIATVRITLYRTSNGSTWVEQATWRNSQDGFVYVSGTKSVEPGYTYKVVNEGNVKDAAGNILESARIVSPIVAY